jgi:uncharacterized protein YecE (DUF72 family)
MDTREEGCDIRIGTSGYDYPDWVGVLYPKGLGRSEFLGAYSEEFDSLELNFSYYGMPRAEKLAAMLGRTRRPIDFSIKANRLLTHEPSSSASVNAEAALEFRKGIEPLAAAGRLVAVLFEFPFSFRYGVEERRYLERLLLEFRGLPAVVEFRNAEWYSARVFEGLRARGVGFCAVDLPRLEGLPPLTDIVTADLAYVRFHGRNAATWWAGDARSRFDYGYGEEELRGWIPRLEGMSAQSRRLRGFFNNHARGQAVEAARTLKRLLVADRLLPGKP